jgi:hypothetical protein
LRNELGALDSRALSLLSALKVIAQKGPLPAQGHGDTSVGNTLLHHLGVPITSLAKASANGIVISARRGSKIKDHNRVNLFAKVPEWELSSCKSTRDILDICGYERNGERRLYCTVKSRKPNSQGLYLEVDSGSGLLREKQLNESGVSRDVVVWRLLDLEVRLVERHPESAWVLAVPSKRDGKEYFHYRFVRFTGRAHVGEFSRLLDLGAVTVDHLISERDGRVSEKGPLFKISPDNVDALFPTSPVFDLLR